MNNCDWCAKGKHAWRVLGTPRSAMTYYVCEDCGAKKERGPGLFYGMQRPITKTLEQGDIIEVVEDYAPYFYLGDKGVVVNSDPTMPMVDFRGMGNVTVYKCGVYRASSMHFKVVEDGCRD